MVEIIWLGIEVGDYLCNEGQIFGFADLYLPNMLLTLST